LLFYNFSVHKTLDADRATAAGVVDRMLETEDCISVIEAAQPAARLRPFSLSRLHLRLL